MCELSHKHLYARGKLSAHVFDTDKSNGTIMHKNTTIVGLLLAMMQRSPYSELRAKSAINRLQIEYVTLECILLS